MTRVAVLVCLLMSIVSASVAQSLESERVQYPSAEIAFICGPQLRSGSVLNPFPTFDSTQVIKGASIGAELPAIAPRGLTGTVSVSNGSSTITGVGTRFTHEVDPRGPAPDFNGWLRVFDGSNYREVRVAIVQSDTSLTLTSAWSFSSLNGATADTFHYSSAQSVWNYDWYYRASYYDTSLVEYINAYRTADPTFLLYARKTADAWWGSQYIDFGTVTQGPNFLPPRSQAFAGLMLRALDGKPENWDYLYRTVRATFDNWLKLRRDYPALYYDLREDGYAQLYAVMMARVLPDQYPLYADGTLKPSTGMATDGAQKRAALLADAEDIAVNFFGRLQKADGSWRWDADAGSDPNSQYRNIEQPFLVGLYLESVVLLHELTVRATVKQNLMGQLTKSVRHLYNDAFDRNPVTNVPPFKWRGFVYFWGGGTVVQPKLFDPPTPMTTACGLKNCGDNSVTGARQLNSTIHHAFGYAYAITGDMQYRTMGDDIFGASFGDATDSIKNLAADAGAKEYDQNFRTSGKYLVWRLLGAGTPTPTPTPSSTPTPTPTPTPSPTPTPGLPPPVSLGLVSSASALASRLATSSLTTVSEIAQLVTSISAAHAVFLAEQNRFSSVNEIDRELRASLYFARGAEALARTSSPRPGFENRLDLVAYYLSRAGNGMLSMTEGPTSNSSLVANTLAAGGTPIIGPAEALSSASFAPVLAPVSLGTILGDPNQSPLSTLTTNATFSSAGELPYELSGVSVAIGGRAARLFSVSPSRIYFSVPADVPFGETEVIVTSQEGFVSRGVTTIAALVPGIFTANGYGMGDAVVLNAVTLESGEFKVTTAKNFGADKRTRLMIFGSGLSSGVLNTNTSNDVPFGLGIFPNIAESVVVEARTSDNRIFQLPVEFVGPSDRSYGLDQINVRLISELRGVGNVELTLVIAGHRSNMATIKLM